jgi:hypothetical protein
MHGVHELLLHVVNLQVTEHLLHFIIATRKTNPSPVSAF